ncbi:prolyl oligopeptidase family serine peptidase [Kangiella sp. HZ709]|uniref:prolyl oligopeptidase family serine peptidase n=1 Tax=Kangiella sp. HZ709 TaxID=2666328 RepID=UPI0012AF9BF2|nr:prolyl oligopeptidase family serine peptidase [Kangiella sp. HZ709]MRX27064.1 prolyl oligopeptidase family serine peptidase [Kangiella sp. HZ709]
MIISKFNQILESTKLVSNNYFSACTYAALVFLLIACTEDNATSNTSANTAESVKYPEIDYSYPLFGKTLNNKYQWLEDNDSEATQEWLEIQEQNNLEYFDSKEFQQLKIKLAAKTNVSFPFVAKKNYFYYLIRLNRVSNKNSWQFSLYNKITHELSNTDLDIPQDKEIVAMSLSNSGRFVGILESQAKNFQWRLFDTFTNSFRSISLPVTSDKTQLSWVDDTQFIFTSNNSILRADVFGVNQKTLFNLEEHLKETELITQWKALDATLIFGNTQLFVSSENLSSSEKRFWVINGLGKSAETSAILFSSKAELELVGSSDNNLYFLTDLAASRNRIISIDLNKPQRRYWKEVIAQTSGVLIDARYLGNQWLLLYRDNGQSELFLSKQYGKNKVQIGSTPPYSEIHFTKSNLSNVKGKALLSEKPLLTIEALNQAARPIEIKDNNLTPIFSNGDFSDNFKSNLADYAHQLSFYRSEDSSRIPISLLAKESIAKDKPVLLIANQGFGMLDDYHYSAFLEAFLAYGGTLAIAHIRSGGTYGKNWHKSATGNKKNKAIEDLLAAQNWLLDKNYTSSGRLAVLGDHYNSSIIAQAINNRESKFSAALLIDGYFNLVEYSQTKPLQKTWQDEYGEVSNKNSLDQLLTIDPFSNINNKAYPALFVFSQSHLNDNMQYLAKIQNHTKNNLPLIFSTNHVELLPEALYFLKNQLKIKP